MRIERLTVEGFGKLGSFDSGPAPLGPMVVVVGPNEAGKSTLFSFLTTALYGFHPASRDRNPHVPWDTDEAGGEIRIRLSDDGCASIARRLRSSPSAKLTIGRTTREIRNQPVPWVEHVPRAVFRQVFAITLAELAGLDEETWARIQDRVLGAMGTTDLKPARLAADALEQTAAEIWRPNRRGNQRLRILQDEIRTLRGARLEALERDRVIRSRVEELETARHALRELRGERAQAELVLERVQELLPIKQQLERIAELRNGGGVRDELLDLPAEVDETLARLADDRQRLASELARLDDDREAPQEVAARWGDEQRAFQAARVSINALSRLVAGYDDTRAAALDAEAGELSIQLQTASDQLLTAPAPGDALRSISVDLLQDRVRRAEAARGDSARRAAEDAARRARAAEDRPTAPGTGVITAAVAVGVAAIAWGFTVGPSFVAALGAAIAAVGATLWFLGRGEDDGVDQGPARPNADAPDPVLALEHEITEMLAGLPIRDAFLDPAGPALVSAIERTQALLRRQDEVDRRRDEASTELSSLEAECNRVADQVGTVYDGDAIALSTSLDHRLAEADRAEEAARAARGELERLDRDRARVARQHAELEEEERALRERVRRIAGEDEADAVAVVQGRIRSHARADRLLDELEHNRPDLPEARARIRDAERDGASWVMTDADVADRRAHLSELTDRIEALIGRTEALETEIAHLREEQTVDVVDGEILSLQEEEKRLTIERDRNWLIAQLLRTADRRFREEHQPDLLRRASGYLERLTAGRYHRILVDEVGDGELFQLAGPGLPRPVPLARPISTGTLEQAYLSLRLAIVDHLDHGQERLPLFLDEALVNWDAARRERGLDVLAEVSESRQVFSFTCHPDMASRLEARGAQVVRLDR